MKKKLEDVKLTEAIKERRSYRKLKNTPEFPKEKLAEAVKTALYAPSAFNMQSARLVVLTGKDHEELWNITKETLRPLVPEEGFKATEDKLKGFRDGIGTILIFENETTVKNMEDNIPLYAENFKPWSLQGLGMTQYALWLALSAQGLAVSLQHYNPLIDEKVKAKWNIPQEWRLIGQMPFGWSDEELEEKTFLPFEETVKFIQ